MAERTSALTIEEFRTVKLCETLEEALQWWASTRAAVNFNEWQPIYAQTRRLFVGRDPAVARTTNFSKESSEACPRTGLEDFRVGRGAQSGSSPPLPGWPWFRRSSGRTSEVLVPRRRVGRERETGIPL